MSVTRQWGQALSTTTPGEHEQRPNECNQLVGPSTSEHTAEWAQTRWNEHEQGQEQGEWSGGGCGDE